MDTNSIISIFILILNLYPYYSIKNVRKGVCFYKDVRNLNLNLNEHKKG